MLRTFTVCLRSFEQNGNTCDSLCTGIAAQKCWCCRRAIGHLYASECRASLFWNENKQNKTSNDCNEHWIFHVAHLVFFIFSCSRKIDILVVLRRNKNNDFSCLIYWKQFLCAYTHTHKKRRGHNFFLSLFDFSCCCCYRRHFAGWLLGFAQ